MTARFLDFTYYNPPSTRNHGSRGQRAHLRWWATGEHLSNDGYCMTHRHHHRKKSFFWRYKIYVICNLWSCGIGYVRTLRTQEILQYVYWTVNTLRTLRVETSQNFSQGVLQSNPGSERSAGHRKLLLYLQRSRGTWYPGGFELPVQLPYHHASIPGYRTILERVVVGHHADSETASTHSTFARLQPTAERGTPGRGGEELSMSDDIIGQWIAHITYARLQLPSQFCFESQ